MSHVKLVNAPGSPVLRRWRPDEGGSERKGAMPYLSPYRRYNPEGAGAGAPGAGIRGRFTGADVEAATAKRRATAAEKKAAALRKKLDRREKRKARTAEKKESRKRCGALNKRQRAARKKAGCRVNRSRSMASKSKSRSRSGKSRSGKSRSGKSRSGMTHAARVRAGRKGARTRAKRKAARSAAARSSRNGGRPRATLKTRRRGRQVSALCKTRKGWRTSLKKRRRGRATVAVCKTTSKVRRKRKNPGGQVGATIERFKVAGPYILSGFGGLAAVNLLPGWLLPEAQKDNKALNLGVGLLGLGIVSGLLGAFVGARAGLGSAIGGGLGLGVKAVAWATSGIPDSIVRKALGLGTAQMAGYLGMGAGQYVEMSGIESEPTSSDDVAGLLDYGVSGGMYEDMSDFVSADTFV